MNGALFQGNPHGSDSCLNSERFSQLITATDCLYRLDKYKEARVQQMFPDEIDTPIDTPARVRFQKCVSFVTFIHVL